MSLIIMPTQMAEHIDKLVADFRAATTEATDEDGAAIRQQLVNTFAEYGHIPEFTIVKTEQGA